MSDNSRAAASHSQFFHLRELQHELPASADTILKDLRMADDPAASCRLIRIYRRLPLHFHESSNENVYILHGRARFQLEGEIQDVEPGTFIHFPKRAVHGVLEIFEHPLLVLTIDTPCRPDEDVTFCNPEEAEPADFK